MEKAFIHAAIGIDLAAKDGFEKIQKMYKTEWENIRSTGKCTPMFSNLGKLSEIPICFGKTLVGKVEYISPAFLAPAIMLGICTYNFRTSLCISYYSPEVSRSKVDLVLSATIDTIKQQQTNGL